MNDPWEADSGGIVADNAPIGENPKQIAIDKLRLPSTFLLASSSLSLVFALGLGLINLVAYATGAVPIPSDMSDPNQVGEFVGTIAGLVVGVSLAAFVIYGSIKTRKATSHGLALATGIAALVPCLGNCLCCIINLPIGIWLLVVISDPLVKRGFDY